MPFLLQPINCTANNETILLPSPFHAGSRSVSLQEVGCTVEFFYELLPQEEQEKPLALSWALSTLIKTTTRWRWQLTNEGNAWRPSAEPSWKPPCSQIHCPQDKRVSMICYFQCKLFFAPRSKGITNSLVLRKLFTLAESGHKLETIWQKQSSQKCQLRKVFLPKTSTAPIGLTAHTLLSALSFSAKSTSSAFSLTESRSKWNGPFTH